MPKHTVIRKVGEGQEGIVEEVELEGHGRAVKKTLRPFHSSPAVIPYRGTQRQMVEKSSPERVNEIILQRLKSKLEIIKGNPDLFVPVLDANPDEGWFIMEWVDMFDQYSRTLEGDLVADRLREKLDKCGLQRVTDIRKANVGIYNGREIVVDFMAHPRNRPLDSYL